MTNPKMNSPQKARQTMWLLFAGFGTLIVLCVGFAMLPGQSAPPEPPAKPVTALSYNEISNNQKQMTGVQWDAYEKSIKGQRVQWQGFVSEIKPDILGDNYIWVDMGNPPDGSQDVYFEYPVENSLQYSKGQRITFQGTFDGGIEIIDFTIVLKDAAIVK